MKKGYTHISLVLDRSGSMDQIKKDTIGGFNSFLKSQKECPGEATFSMVQFDTEYEVIHDFKNIRDIPDLTEETFSPRGMTALYDAIGRCVKVTGEKLSAMKEEDRPEKVLVVILTDGEENSSKEFKSDGIKVMIDHQQGKYSWSFVFIGANQDAVLAAQNIGIKSGNALNLCANAVGTSAVYSSLSNNVTSYRCCSRDAVPDMDFFNDGDRQKQDDAGKDVPNATKAPTSKAQRSGRRSRVVTYQVPSTTGSSVKV